MFDDFTSRARASLVRAQQISAEYNHQYLGCEHLLLGLSAVEDGLAARVLTEVGATEARLREALLARMPVREDLDEREADALATIGIDIGAVRQAVETVHGPDAFPDRRNKPPFTPRAKNALEQSLREAVALNHGWYVDTARAAWRARRRGEPGGQTAR